MRQRYTDHVGSWRHRIASVIMAVALTGAPAALAACAALCAEHVDHDAPRAGHGPGCSAPAAESRVSARRACCPVCDMTPLVSVAALRADGGVWLAVALVAIDAPFHAPKSVTLAQPTGPPDAVPSAGQIAPVLRI